jgi:hypothetical protein
VALVLDQVPAALREQVAAALRGLGTDDDQLDVRVTLTPAGWQVTVEPEGPSLLPRSTHDDVAEMMSTFLNTTMPNQIRR